MRKALIFIIVLVAIVAAMPYGMGLLTKKSIEDIVGKASQNTGIKLEIKNYQLGWLGSKVDIVGTFNAKVDQKIKDYLQSSGRKFDAKIPCGFTFQQKIQHGPLLWGYSNDDKSWYLGRGLAFGQVQFDTNTSLALKDLLGSAPIMRKSTLIGLGGNFNSQLEILGLQHNNKEKQIFFKWDGLRAKVSTSANFDTLISVVNFLKLQITAPEFNLEIPKIIANNDTAKNKQFGIWTGQGTVTWPSFKLTADGKQIEMENLNVSTSQNIAGDLVNGNFKLNLKKLDVDKDVYGPVDFDMVVNNLDAKSIGEIEQALREINQQNLAPNQVQAQMMMLMPKIIKMVSRGAVVEIKVLDVKTPDGVVSARFKITLPKQEGDSKGPPMQDLYRKAVASVNLKIPAILLNKLMVGDAMRSLARTQSQQHDAVEATQQAATTAANGVPAVTPPPATPVPSEADNKAKAEEMAKEKLAQLESKGMLVKEGDNYKFDATYDNGKVTINGKPMPGAM